MNRRPDRHGPAPTPNKFLTADGYIEGWYKPYPRHLDWMRYIAAFLLFVYGSSKLDHLQFHMNQELAQRPIASLTRYELTWFYYGFSRTYACILGLTQIFGAALLLFRKTSLLGAITILPVIINILLIDLLILPPDYGPMVPALMICLSLLMLFQRDFRTLAQATLTTQASSHELTKCPLGYPTYHCVLGSWSRDIWHSHKVTIKRYYP